MEVPIYAIVRSGGKQYRVEPSQTLDVERIDAEVGSKVDLGVLLLGGDGETKVGTPLLDGVKVVAEVVEHGRGPKIRVFKYKNKTRYRRRQGHRQGYTRLTIREIVAGGKSVSQTEERRTVRRPRSLAEPEADEPGAAAKAEAPEATAVAAPPAEEQPRPRARRAGAKAAATEQEGAEAPKPRSRRAAASAEAEGEAPQAQAEGEEEGK